MLLVSQLQESWGGPCGSSSFNSSIKLVWMKGAGLICALVTFSGVKPLCDFALCLRTKPASRVLGVMTFSIALY